MHKIKFRGKTESGHYCYGLLTRTELGNTGRYGYAILTDDNQTVSVSEESIAQSIGYDMRGKEIYGDDIVTDGRGKTYPAADYLNCKFAETQYYTCLVVELEEV